MADLSVDAKVFGKKKRKPKLSNIRTILPVGSVLQLLDVLLAVRLSAALERLHRERRVVQRAERVEELEDKHLEHELVLPCLGGGSWGDWASRARARE